MSEEVKNDKEQIPPVDNDVESDGQDTSGEGENIPDETKDSNAAQTPVYDPQEPKRRNDHIDTIDVMEMTPADVPGIVIGLNPNDTLWRMETYPESGEYVVDLNRFSGKITKRLPAKLHEEYAKSILASLQLGTIRVYEKEISVDPAVKNTSDIMNPLSIEARKFISELKLEKFKEAVVNINREELIYRCIDLEKREKNREPFLKALRARAKEITG